MKKKLVEKLKDTSVVIASHIFATGPALELEEYLVGKSKKLLFIGHPFSYTNNYSSFFRLRSKNDALVEGKSVRLKLPEVFLYIKEAFYTLSWSFKLDEKIDIFIGSDNYLAFLGLILKRIGKVKSVILYTIDYTPNRFTNFLLNFFYHYFDRACLRNCDIVWNVSPRMKSAREKTGIKSSKSTPQIHVPLGAWVDRIPNTLFSKRDKYSLVFMGHILKKQGLQKVIKGLPSVLEKYKKLKLTIIGTGPYLNNLKYLVKKFNLSRNVLFKGYIKDHKKLEILLTKSLIGLATYKPDKKSFTYNADPGKIKNYLAAGLSVLVTDVPRVANDIEQKKAGYIVKYDEADISNKIIKLFSDEKRLEFFSKNARNLSKKYDWNQIFSNALTKSLK